MAVSYTVENVAGVGPFTLPSDIELLPFARVPLQSQIEVVLDGVTLSPVTDYAVNESLGTFTLASPMVGTETLVFNRVTSTQTLATFVDGARLTADELNLAYRQNSLLIEELNEDLDSLVLNSNPGTLPSVGNAGYILSKVDGNTNTATWIDLDSTSAISNLQSSIAGFQGQIDGLSGTIGNPTDTNGPSIYGLINEVEIVAVDASSDVSALETQLYGTDINSPAAGTVLFRVNEAESAVTDKLDKVTTSAQSVASEITFDNAVTLENEIKATSGRISTDSATRLAVPAALHPAAATDLTNEVQYNNRFNPFSIEAVNNELTNNEGDRRLHLMSIGTIVVDEIAQGGADARYLYPDDFKESSTNASYDTTGYTAPGNGNNPNADGSVDSIYYPGHRYRPNVYIDVNNPAKIFEYADVGQTVGLGGYFDSRAITEPMPGSGNINRDAPLRFFNALGFSDSLNNVSNRFQYRSIFDGTSQADQDILTNNYSGYVDRASTTRRANILYVPGSDNGGLVRIQATFNHGISQDNPRVAILMFTGMDEANQSLGHPDSIIPVAARRFSTTNSGATLTIEYTFDNRDGMPRYFGFGQAGSGDVNAQRLTRLTVSRSSSPITGSFHDVDTLNSFEYTRDTYDPTIQQLLIDNFVAQ